MKKKFLIFGLLGMAFAMFLIYACNDSLADNDIQTETSVVPVPESNVEFDENVIKRKSDSIRADDMFKQFTYLMFEGSFIKASIENESIPMNIWENLLADFQTRNPTDTIVPDDLKVHLDDQADAFYDQVVVMQDLVQKILKKYFTEEDSIEFIMLVFQKALSSDENSEDEYIVAADCCAWCKYDYDKCLRRAGDSNLKTYLSIQTPCLLGGPKVGIVGGFIGVIAGFYEEWVQTNYCKEDYEDCKKKCGKKCD